MDKETLSNYGWITICVLVIAIMVALATPFGSFIKTAVENTTQGLFDVENKAMGCIVQNKWKDRDWVAFGTSITATDNTLGQGGTPSGKYIPYLEELSEMNLISNRGIAGGSICGHLLYYVYYYRGEYKRADIVTVEGSVNDWFSSHPLGSVGDTIPYVSNSQQVDVKNYIQSIGGSETGTFAGSVYQVFKTIQDNAMDAKIVYITENTGVGICDKDEVNDLGLKQQDYIDMAVAVAENMGVSVIDAGCVISNTTPQYLNDHIHHSELGGQAYAKTIWEKLKWLSTPALKEKIITLTTNYFDKNAEDIEYGGIYYSQPPTWLNSVGHFESGFIKIPINTTFYLFGTSETIHYEFYKYKTKEFAKSYSCGQITSGDRTYSYFNFGEEWTSKYNDNEPYVYVRFGAPIANIDDIIFTPNQDGIIE